MEHHSLALAPAATAVTIAAAWCFRQKQKPIQEALESKREALRVFTVQLVFSDGGLPRYRENFWQLYAIALTPFVLGIPASQVDLILAHGFIGYSSSAIKEVAADAAAKVDGIQIMPDGYKAYFESVYARASTLDSLPLPACSLRLISGHAFGNFKGGNIKIGNIVIRYPQIGANATCLTILDICNAAYAVANFEQIAKAKSEEGVPTKKKWMKFDKTALFEGELTVPVACDKNDATWAFRVGYEGQHAVAPSLNEIDNKCMSMPIGDSIASSFLIAVKDFIEQHHQGNLDQLFYQTYASLNTALLDSNNDPPNPHSSLATIQSIITDGILPVRMEAFKSPFFRLQAEWFLTMEQPLSLTEQDGEIAEEIIEFVVDHVIQWYKENIEADVADSQTQWQTFVNCMGPFCQELRAVRLLLMDNGSIVRAENDKGLALEAWASSCGGLPDILSKVERKIRSGEFE